MSSKYMIIQMLKGKLHRGTITESRLDYEGSITVAEDLLEASGILPYEQVDVLDVNNGQRFTTYAITGKRGSGEICVNGAAARLVQKGDTLIICSYCQIDIAEAKKHKPAIVLLNPDNTIKSR